MKEHKDLSIIIDDVKLNVRVGAIIKYQDKILVEKNKNADFGVIPGGRIKTLETAKIALLRELTEELGIDLSKEQFEMVSLIENFFILEEKKYHEIYFVYKVDLKGNYNLFDGIKNLDNLDSNYYLLTDEELQKEKILPNILKKLVHTTEFKHYVINDINK